MSGRREEERPDRNAASASALFVAIENYDHHPRLERTAEAACALANALSERGIATAYPNCLRGGRAYELVPRVLAWMRDASQDDRLLLYWSGHGMREADGFYLIAQDSPVRNFNQDNAVMPGSLAKGAANSKARKVMIVLDACFSGEALGAAVGTIAAILSAQTPDVGSRRGIAVLASAHALQKAQEGIVSGVLKELLTEVRATRRWSDQDHFIDWDRLVASLQDEIEKRGLEQQIVPTTIGSTIELLPNPRYRAGEPAEIVEERAWRLAGSAGGEHFDLASRGIEVGRVAGILPGAGGCLGCWSSGSRARRGASGLSLVRRDRGSRR
jgi:Caspase domain